MEQAVPVHHAISGDGSPLRKQIEGVNRRGKKVRCGRRRGEPFVSEFGGAACPAAIGWI